MSRKKARVDVDGPSYLRKSIETLEGSVWGSPDYESYVVTRTHALRTKPLEELTNEELRLALSQQVGLPWVLSLALVRLSQDLAVSGDFYPGDVLVAALKLPFETWQRQASLKDEFIELAKTAIGSPDLFEDWNRQTILEAAAQFLAPH